MIFSELYSAYYNTVAKIMEAAFNPEATEKDLQRCVMNNRNKLIELFIYIVIVVVGIVLLLTGGADDKTSAENMGGESYAVVLDE